MFEDISPPDFAFKARDVLDKNSLLEGKVRYNADYEAMQRIHVYIRENLAKKAKYVELSKIIPKALQALAPYSEVNEMRMCSLSDTCFEYFDTIIDDVNQGSIDEYDMHIQLSASLLKVFSKYIKSHDSYTLISGRGSNNSLDQQDSSATTLPDDEGIDSGGEEDFDDAEYEIPVAHISPNLRVILGLISAEDAAEQAIAIRRQSSWEVPQTYGLSNSRQIISPADYDALWQRSKQFDVGFNQNESNAVSDDDDESDSDFDDNDDGEVPSGAMSVNLMKALGMDTTGMEVETDWKPPERSGLEHSKPIFSANTRKEGNSRNISRHQSEDDDESDYDFDDNDDGEVPSGAMSVNLMKALGMDTTGMEVETDWKPPERSGLEHSKPIFPAIDRRNIR